MCVYMRVVYKQNWHLSRLLPLGACNDLDSPPLLLQKINPATFQLFFLLLFFVFFLFASLTKQIDPFRAGGGRNSQRLWKCVCHGFPAAEVTPRWEFSECVNSQCGGGGGVIMQLVNNKLNYLVSCKRVIGVCLCVCAHACARVMLFSLL